MSDLFEKVVLIVGSGAVENAWKPILRILQPGCGPDFDADAANVFLASIVYQLRFCAHLKDELSALHLKQMIWQYNGIKADIARELIRWEKEKKIRARQEYFSILNKFIFHSNIQFCLISTNWDTVIDNATNFYGHSTSMEGKDQIKTYHLHGIATQPSEMYMPSEITKEPYCTETADKSMVSLHGATAQVIANSNRTILYGLSLDPLDAELLTVLSFGWNKGCQKEIIIINPDHKTVAKRVRTVLNNLDRATHIIAYSPDDLNAKVQY